MSNKFMVGFSGVISRAKNVSYNVGLRNYMLGVYNYMTVALALSGLVAYLTASSGLVNVLFSTPLGIIISFSPLVISIVMSLKISSAKISTIKTLYFAYAVLMGLSLSSIFLVFSGVLIAKTFFITASMFGVMSIYGYTTKKDLSGYGHILMMIVLGLLIASIVNLFTHSSGLQFGISCISVVVFALLVAYDTQSLKQMYYAVCHDQNIATRMGIFGALQIYIDFVAIFIHLLQIFASLQNRRN